MSDGARGVDGKVALVTGAGSGIGRAVCLRLSADGAEVVLTSRDAGHVAETCDAVEAVTQRRPSSYVLDLEDGAGIKAMVEQVGDRYGRLDILSNNAGIDLTHAPALEDTADEEWERLFRVNVTSIFQTCRAALPLMGSGSSIVNMASMNSFVAWENNAPYSATKGALLQFTRALALECAPRNIRANAVCPGIIETPMTEAFIERAEEPERLRREYAAVAPLGRMGSPDEVAHCVRFLAGDESSFITGAALLVDGGTTAR